MVELLIRLKNAAKPVINAARCTFIERELIMWGLPITPEALTAFVNQKISEFRSVLEEDMALCQDRASKLRELC
ncbi:unnamed protein product, partial [Auanema sp. JU1783]